MSQLIQYIKDKRQEILIGEIGALLHDIGKLHPDFIKKQSKEGGIDFDHCDLDKFLDINLIKLIKDETFKIDINGKETNVYSLIKEHHHKGNLEIVKFLQFCDRLDSADDKGIVRRKQSVEKTIIVSPFGYQKEKIDLSCLKKRLEDLQKNLIGIFQNYIDGTLELTCFRRSIITNLKTAFSHALGETRIPANDVTLWDHSHSTSSLFKSVLCAIALGENIDEKRLQWRILGFCWDGVGFINKGRKIADVLQRNSIIENMKGKLRNEFEDEIPIGNAIYEDINGIYFTFPALTDDKAKELAKECGEIALKIIRDESKNEIWPFFTLSKCSRTLTILADELKFSAEKRNIPKITPTLFVEGRPEKKFDNPEMPIPQKEQDKKEQDICPVCRLRPKLEKEERCNVCKERIKGRLISWLDNREDTIWINEVADVDNRIALLTLSFDLDKWLAGTMIGTIYSQCFEDWLDKEKENLYKIQDELKDKIKQQIESLERAIEGMKKAKDQSRVKDKINEKTKEKRELEQKIKQLTFTLRSDKETIYKFLEIFFEKTGNDKKKAARILDTFFEDVNIIEDHLDKEIDNIEERIGAKLTKENLATYLFTQNPSPARLYRIWKETSEFFELVTKKIKEDFYSFKWKRIRFTLKLNNDINLNNSENTPFIIKIEGLEPENILVLHATKGQFYTIESVDRFKFNKKYGVDAVEDALNKEIYWLTKEDEPDDNLLNNGKKIKATNINKEGYNPVVEITRSPLILRLIVPALDSIKITELITKLYNEKFEKVLGKLPLNIGLLVSKRKFPLYVLLDVCERLFHSKEFKEPVTMDVWWEITGLREDKYYGFYPTRRLNDNEKYNLDDLAPLSKGKTYALYPGYFDFDLLAGTQDRFNITYKERKRAGEDYALFSNRPYYFYHISQMVDLWEILKNNLSSSQINFIEESLMNKLREWKSVKDSNKKDVFRKFTEATIKDAFANSWSKLRKETQDLILNSALNGLLLDTFALFRHIIKEKEEEEKNE